MKKLNTKKVSEIIGGDWRSRYYKQWYKCLRGEESGCNRAARIRARHADESLIFDQ